jgi:glycosyltransferase involved in cell wall biosynthesis
VGYVDDPRPLLSETAVFVVPLLAGGGMRVKIIDGWTWGLPIVSTTVGAEGIALQEGVQILLADEPGAFADAVVRVLREPALRDRLASSGRAWAEERYGWRSVYRAWNGVYATPAHAETQS